MVSESTIKFLTVTFLVFGIVTYYFEIKRELNRSGPRVLPFTAA